MITNPFDDRYVEQEIAFYDLPEEAYDRDGVSVLMKSLVGRLDDYLNKNFRTGSLEIPVFYIDGEVWMSLTPMELQAAYLAIDRSEGRVAAGGLGMGYYVLKAAARPEVESVDVYEVNPRVILFFRETFKGRIDKINFILGDAREQLIGKEYDFVFMDIYKTMLSDVVLADAELFMEENDIDDYRFFCQERFFVDEVMLRGVRTMSWLTLSTDEKEFTRKWLMARLGRGCLYGEPVFAHRLWSPLTTVAFREKMFKIFLY